MTRRIGLAALSMFTFSGCSICAPGYIDDYATVGGKWTRSDPENGRVGSPFSDAGSGMDAGQYAAPIYEGDTYDAGSIEIYEGDAVYEGDLDTIILEGPGTYSDGTPIEVIPQYEEGSIILGDEW